MTTFKNNSVRELLAHIHHFEGSQLERFVKILKKMDSQLDEADKYERECGERYIQNTSSDGVWDFKKEEETIAMIWVINDSYGEAETYICTFESLYDYKERLLMWLEGLSKDWGIYGYYMEYYDIIYNNGTCTDLKGDIPSIKQICVAKVDSYGGKFEWFLLK